MVVSGLGAAGRAGNASSPAAVRRAGGPPPEAMDAVVRGSWRVAGALLPRVEPDDAPDSEGTPIHEGCGVERAPLCLELGSAGNAADGVVVVVVLGGLLDDVDADPLPVTQFAPGTDDELLAPTEGVEDAMLDILPRLVLFLSLRTLVVCLEFWAWFCAPPDIWVGLATAALAHPLLEVVAPCMPPRPGRDG